MNKQPENLILEKTFQFALDVMAFTAVLKERGAQDLARQLFRSGTSIGANVREAQGAESRSDFAHKLKIAFKEAEETEYWLLLCARSKNYPNPGELEATILSIKRILSKIISSTKNKS